MTTPTNSATLIKRLSNFKKKFIKVSTNIDGYLQDYSHFVDNYTALLENKSFPHGYPLLSTSVSYEKVLKKPFYNDILFNIIKKINLLAIDTNHLMYCSPAERSVLKTLLFEISSLHDQATILETKMFKALLSSSLNNPLLDLTDV